MKIYESNPPQAPSVSILTPVCNTSQFLPKCLDSLLAQTLKDIEIICINDGSTDNSLDILLEYQKRDSRIRVVDKPNAGYGATMNLGISLARGAYVGILESDDFADSEMFSKLFRFAEWHDCDLVKCSFIEHSSEGDVKQHPFDGHRYCEVFDPRDDITVTYQAPIIWAALYRRTMLLENGVRFNETPGASYQDTSFVFQCWVSARRAAILPDCLINYRVDNAGSSVKSSKKVFAVCDEYALSSTFLDERPERRKDFGAVMQVIKLGTYKWNYNRLEGESKRKFAQRMTEEYRIARDAGELNQDLFGEGNWRIVQDAISGADVLLEKYSEFPL